MTTDSTADSASDGRLFARLDDAPPEQRRIAFDYLVALATHQEIQRVRTAAFEMFAPARDERLLDAGCGAGEVARQLGARVGARGSVTAVDVSQEMVSAARTRQDGGPVTYVTGDITALDFPDGHFDGVRSERVFQHLAKPEAAMAELARVTRPGGRVCVIDTDWASCVWDGLAPVTAEIVNHLLGMSANPASGRRLRALAVGAGLRDTVALPVTVRFASPEDAAVLAPIFRFELLRDHLPAELFEPFVASVESSVERGDFLFAFTMWIVTARQPWT